MRLTTREADGLSERAGVEDVRTVADAWTRVVAQPNERRSDGQPAGLVILVNGRLANWRTELHDGDVVRFVAAPGGG